MKRAKMRSLLNNLLANIPSNLPLSEWLDKASEISIGVADALEGIYCGREGMVHEPIGDGLYITFGWYTVADTPRIEYAYVS